jgi:hypothetical protein
MAILKKPHLKRNIGIVVLVIVAMLLAIIAGFSNGFFTTETGISNPTSTPTPPSGITLQAPTPYPSPTSTLIINKIQVSGTITIADLETQPTSIEFLDTATNSGYFATVQNGFYSTSLPNQQTYEVFAMGGSTVNIAGMTTSAIDMGNFSLNAGFGVTSITKNFSG